MTKEELKAHCKKQIEGCEMWAKHKGEEPHGKVYEEHKLILELLEQKPKTGHWIIDIKDMDYCFCSECQHRFDVDHLKFSWDKYEFPPHCPNCGAYMRDKESEA